jgi:hypothetical protein
MAQHIHLIKLSVGSDDLADHLGWYASGRANGPDGQPRHITRMWPKREAEVLAGGSIYWVIKGMILTRQRIVRLDRLTGEDGIERCAIVLDPQSIRVAPTPRQPFQGWRYLDPAAAPPDLAPVKAGEEPLPPALSAVLAEMGVL